METKLSILNALDKHSEGLHLRKLTEEIDGSFPNVRRFVLNLVDEGVLKTEQQGNLLNVKLNASLPTLAYLKEVHTSRLLEKSEAVRGFVFSIIQKLTIKPIIVLIFGAHAQEKIVGKTAPIEMLFVFQSVEQQDSLKQQIQQISQSFHLVINPVFVDYLTFEKSFLDREHAFSNKIRKENLIVIGVEYFYTLLWRFLG